MQIGAEVRVSTPVNKASAKANPFTLRLNTGIASRIASIQNLGKASAKSVSLIPG